MPVAPSDFGNMRTRFKAVTQFTGLSPCTMAQIPTRQRILASQNLWKHEGQVTTQKRIASSIHSKLVIQGTGVWLGHACWGIPWVKGQDVTVTRIATPGHEAENTRKGTVGPYGAPN